jgi:hypothetical protein
VTTYEVPDYLIDPETLPASIKTSDGPESFAFLTFKDRIPGILEETIKLNNFPAEIEASVRALQV